MPTVHTPSTASTLIAELQRGVPQQSYGLDGAFVAGGSSAPTQESGVLEAMQGPQSPPQQQQLRTSCVSQTWPPRSGQTSVEFADNTTSTASVAGYLLALECCQILLQHPQGCGSWLKKRYKTTIHRVYPIGCLWWCHICVTGGTSLWTTGALGFEPAAEQSSP